MNLVLDAAAILVYLKDGLGAELVEAVLTGPDVAFIHAVSLCEVYHETRSSYGVEAADGALFALRRTGLAVREDLDEDFWKEAGRMKSDSPQAPLSACFCAVLADRIGGEVMTADRPGFDPLVRQADCKARFIE